MLLFRFPLELLSGDVLSILLEIGGISLVLIHKEGILVLCEVSSKDHVDVE